MLDEGEAKRHWGLDPKDLEAFSFGTASVHSHVDPMEDTLRLTISIPSTSNDDTRIPAGYPNLLLTARRKGMYTHFETYVSFPDRFFLRKGKGKTVKIRLDAEPAVDCSKDTFDSASLCILRWPVPYAKLLESSVLRIQIVPGIGGGSLSTYALDRARPAIEAFLKAVFGMSFREIVHLNPGVVGTVACFGPQNTEMKKQVLSDLGFFRGAIDTTKGIDFYEAAHRFAVSIQSFEITGTGVDIATGRFHSPWTLELLKKSRPEIRERMGALTIGD